MSTSDPSSTPASVVPEFLDANARYAAEFAAGDLPAPPARKVAVLTCMDARIDPARALGLREGDALRSLIISQQLLGTREVVVIHHTGCGMLSFTDAALQQLLAERFGRDANGIEFGFFTDPEQAVRDDVAAIRADPFIPDDIVVSGFIYDTQTGRVQPVE